MQEVHAHLARIPLFAGLAPEACEIERLGGLTNRNYRVTAGQDLYVLRIPGDGTSEYIDRKAEEPNARVAAAAGVNAEVLYFDTANGVQVTRFIPGAATMNAERFKDLGAVARAAQAFRRIHDCGRQFASDFELFGMMDGELAARRAVRVIADKPGAFPCRITLEDAGPGEALLLAAATVITPAFQSAPSPAPGCSAGLALAVRSSSPSRL